MSKIFEALTRADGEPASSLLPELIGPDDVAAPAAAEQPLLATPVVADTTPAPVRSQAPPATAPVPAAGLQMDRIRTLSLQVPQTAPVLPFDDTHLQASERYRMIRTKILQHPRKPRMIVVSSPGSGDGKSVTAINLAGALSLKTTSNVLLIDGDFRRATIHRQIGFSHTPGLAEVLEGTCALEDALVHTEQFPALYVLPAGDQRANPAELLDSPQWQSLTERIRSAFEYIIVDSPPIAAVADYDLIMAVCDGVVLVARPDHTNRTLCFKALETLPKEKLLGVVLNCASNWFLPGKGQYDSYYYRATKEFRGR